MRERLRQFGQVWTQVRKLDDRFVLYVSIGALLGLLAGVGLGMLMPMDPMIAMPLFGVSLMFLGGMLTFNLRANKAQYRALDGHLGAAAAVLQSMRGQWFVTPAVAVNTKQDMVHRVVGRCGVVLVGEGAGQRVNGLLAKEKKRLSRLGGEVSVHTIVVGDGPDEVPLSKLQGRLSKLPREQAKTEVPKLERKLRSLDKGPPVPKGIDPMAVASRKRPKPR